VKTSSRNASPFSPRLSVGKCSVFAREALRHRPTPAGAARLGTPGSGYCTGVDRSANGAKCDSLANGPGSCPEDVSKR
jgi:hypothetical protein